MLTVKTQILFILTTIGVGWIGGLIFDGYSFAFRLRKPKGWRIWLWDISFWVVMLAITYFFLLITVWGEFRVSIAIALVIGVLIYRKTFKYNKKVLQIRRRLAGLARNSANRDNARANK